MAKKSWTKITTWHMSPFKIVEQPDIGKWFVYRGMTMVAPSSRDNCYPDDFLTDDEAKAWCEKQLEKK